MVSYGEKHVRECLAMGAVDVLMLSETKTDDLLEPLEDEAKKVGTNIEVVSTETREGVQLKEIGGIAALLRFPVHF
jgi:stalled ribosome rescue protein Dom34